MNQLVTFLRVLEGHDDQTVAILNTSIILVVESIAKPGHCTLHFNRTDWPPVLVVGPYVVIVGRINDSFLGVST